MVEQRMEGLGYSLKGVKELMRYSGDVVRVLVNLTTGSQTSFVKGTYQANGHETEDRSGILMRRAYHLHCRPPQVPQLPNQ